VNSNILSGAAIFDLSFLQASQRRIALRYAICLVCVIAVGMLGIFMSLGGSGSRWAFLSWGLSAALFSVILALGSSIAAGTAALAVWVLILPIVVLFPWSQSAWLKYVVGAIVVTASLRCLRFARNAGILRIFSAIIGAPLLGILTWTIGVAFVIAARFLPLVIANGWAKGSIRFALLGLLESLGYIEYMVGGTFEGDPAPLMLLAALTLGVSVSFVFALAALTTRYRGNAA
jgi:hypothetical protein